MKKKMPTPVAVSLAGERGEHKWSCTAYRTGGHICIEEESVLHCQSN